MIECLSGKDAGLDAPPYIYFTYLGLNCQTVGIGPGVICGEHLVWSVRWQDWGSFVEVLGGNFQNWVRLEITSYVKISENI